MTDSPSSARDPGGDLPGYGYTREVTADWLSGAFNGYLFSSKRKWYYKTTIDDVLWAHSGRADEASSAFLPTFRELVEQDDLFIDVMASGARLHGYWMAGGHQWIDRPEGAISALEACLIHMRFLLNYDSHLGIGRRPRRLAKDVQPLVSVAYKAARTSPAQFVGTIAVAGTADIAQDLQNDPRLALELGFLHWPMKHTYDGPSIILTQGETMMYLPLDGDWLNHIVGSTVGHFNVKNDYVLVDICLPKSVSSTSPLKLASEDDSPPVITETFFGAQLGLAWLCNDVALDIWTKPQDNIGLASAVSKFRKEALNEIRRMAEYEPTSQEIVDSVIEQVRAIPDPLAQLILMNTLKREFLPAIQDEMADAADRFRQGGGTWKQIANEFGVSPQSVQQQLDPDARRRAVERNRRWRGAED